MPDRGIKAHLYAADPHWWQYHIADIANDFDGKCWTQDRNWKKGEAEGFGIEVIKSREAHGLSRDPDWLNTGGNSGYQAIGLAYRMGYNRIILLGFDMCRENGKAHWFGEHPKGMNASTKYATYIDKFRTIKPAEYGIEIINCSRRTALDMFDRWTLDDAL